MTDILLYILLAFCVAITVLLIVLLLKKPNNTQQIDFFEKLEKSLNDELRETRKESNENVNNALNNFSERQSSSSVQIAKAQDMRLQGLQVAMTDQMKAVNTRFVEMSAAQEQRLENIRTTMEKRITSLQEENTKSLDQMRQTVDEKLQKTLDEKLKQSFSMVSERLEQVYKGLGEMQTLAIGVGDLKKVLSNVKTRGILGEIQLGAILEQMLSHEQYEENVKTRPNS
ncbi:MAG: DNA recombination protein RmuC, partial [Oscillospiraceae bacterium]